jgi:tetratricopeptide (TPR) repeat protein
MEYENRDDFDSAIQVLQDALKDNRLNEAVIYELAYCYEQLKQYDKAVECFLLYIDEAPYSFTTWYNLANAYSKLGDSDKAIWAYDYCTLINEEFSPAYYNMANVYMDNNNTEQALKHYKKCLEIDGDDGVVYCSLGECYEDLGELERAYEAYTKCTTLLPHLADAWLGKGIISDILGFHLRGVEEVKRAIELEGDNASYWRALANVYDNDDQPENANKAFEKGYELNPQEDDLLLDWLVFLANRSQDLALSKIEENIQIHDTVEAIFVMSFCHWESGNHTESMMLFEEVIEINVDLAKSVFLYFPNLKNIDFFVHRLQELEENEEL